ncbi:glycosyltransferase [Synechococcus sp. GFB01]|uniref:glycosyltransferase n=1 Tax=Synechococcus sp. GFB01 TaxID=1662190 RepID=UPI0009081974|nr:glycosyltransferase [Synechococcus sp. GFB01]
MLLSVAICTYNRAALLERCLESLAAQSAAADAFALLVVDNNCSDGTAQVLERQRQPLPNLRVIHETRQGLSHARNAALAATATPFLAFLDDDAIASPGWVEAALAYLEKADPAVAVVGGPIIPILSRPIPAWIPPWTYPYLTIIDLGDQPRRSSSESLFAGANVIFRVDALRAIGGFCPALGRRGASLLSNEEVYLWQLLRQRGYACAYEPSIPVDHLVDAERLTYRWLMRRLFAEGLSACTMARLLGRSDDPPPLLYLLYVSLLTLRTALGPASLAALLRRRLSRDLVARHAELALKLGRARACWRPGGHERGLRLELLPRRHRHRPLSARADRCLQRRSAIRRVRRVRRVRRTGLCS